MQTAQPVHYATSPSARRSYWPEGILAFIELGLVALGGCFLVGVASMYDIFLVDKPPVIGPTTPGEQTLLAVLYACAGLCMAGAVGVLVLAVTRLMKH